MGAAATLSLPPSLSALPPLAGSIALLASLRPAATGYGWAVGLVLAGDLLGLGAGREMDVDHLDAPTSQSGVGAHSAGAVVLLAVLSAGGLILAGICGEMLMGWIAGLVAFV